MVILSRHLQRECALPRQLFDALGEARPRLISPRLVSPTSSAPRALLTAPPWPFQSGSLGAALATEQRASIRDLWRRVCGAPLWGSEAIQKPRGRAG